ncbi:hypothetical protein Q5O24_12420 [Eubacteriaceae bacterium ES3]|nr:hypothetical protein Q5O24_12420 [Eubacteriaceae bacterium ES3]
MTYTIKFRIEEFIELREHLKGILDYPADAEMIAVEILKADYLSRLQDKFLKQEREY